MRLTTNHGDLSAALDLASALLSSRPPVPILGAIKLTATGEEITLDGFDYSVHVHVVLGGTVEEPGECLVSRAQLREYTRSLLAGSSKAKQSRLPLAIEADDANCTMLVDGYQYRLPTLPLQDYPGVPDYTDEQSVTVSRDALAQAVTRVGVCAGRDDTVPMLTGINLAGGPDNEGLELAATDRFRLGVAYVPTVAGTLGQSRLVPAKELHKALAALPGGPARIGVPGDRDGYARFSAGDVTVGIRCLDLEFVKYRSLIPAENPVNAVVDRRELATAVRRVASAVDRFHHLRIDFSGDAMRLSAGGADEGAVSSPPIAVEHHGRDMARPIAFNAEYLGAALATFGTDSVSLGLTSPGRPLLVAEPGCLGDARSFRMVVMPARLPDDGAQGPEVAASAAEEPAVAAA